MANNPLNATDPTGECSVNADGLPVSGVCPVPGDDLARQMIDDVNSVDGYTALSELDARLESDGLLILVQSDPDSSDGRFIAHELVPNIATARIGSETVTYSGQNTETGEASTYTAGAGENLVHEVVGHGTDWFYGDGATSQAPIGPGHPSGFAPDTPVREVPAMEAENAFIQQKGIPFRRTEYSTNNSVYVVRGRRQ